MTGLDPARPADDVRRVWFHLVPVRDGETMTLAPGEQVLNVQYGSAIGVYYAVVMCVREEHDDV